MPPVLHGRRLDALRRESTVERGSRKRRERRVVPRCALSGEAHGSRHWSDAKSRLVLMVVDPGQRNVLRCQDLSILSLLWDT